MVYFLIFLAICAVLWLKSYRDTHGVSVFKSDPFQKWLKTAKTYTHEVFDIDDESNSDFQNEEFVKSLIGRTVKFRFMGENLIVRKTYSVHDSDITGTAQITDYQKTPSGNVLVAKTVFIENEMFEFVPRVIQFSKFVTEGYGVYLVDEVSSTEAPDND